MVFKELLDYCKAKAIADSLSPTEESIWRDACREYAKNFNTPLMEVHKLDPEHVFLNNFEYQLADQDLEDNIEEVLERIYRLENPNYDLEKEEELQSFIKDVEAEEKKRKIKKTLPKKEENIPENAPTGGSVDFSNLNDEEG